MRAIQSNPPLKFLPIRRDFRFDEKKSLFLTFLLKAQRLNRDILKNSIIDFYSLKLQFRAESKKARKKSRFSKKKKKNCCSSFKSISPVRRFTFSPGSFRVRGGRIDLGTGINDPNRWRKLHFFFFPTFREKIQLARAKPRDEVSPYDPIVLHELISREEKG